MKKIILYQCEICNTRYNSEEEAISCESKGVPQLLPIGTIFSLYKDEPMVFAVIKRYPQAYGHHHAYSLWACRDTQNGDNVGGTEFCGCESWTKIGPPNKKIDAYKRMIKALKNHNIKPKPIKVS